PARRIAELGGLERRVHAVAGRRAARECEEIVRIALDRAVGQILAQYQRNPAQLPPRNLLEAQVLNRLIMTRLQVARADSTGVRVGDADIDNAVQTIARQNNLSPDQLRASLAQDGISYSEFRRNLHDELMVQRLHQRVAQSSAQVSDAEIDIMLASNSLKTGEVHLAHILIGVPDGASAEQLQAAREKAERVKKEIDGGMDFTAAAIRYSNASDALEGGDLGWRRFDQVPSMFADLVQGMKPGDSTPALRGPSGFHILKLVGKRDTGPQMVTEYHARHIMVRMSELVSTDEAQRKVAELRRRLVDGKEDFAKLAKQFSQDPGSANAGGDMGWFAIDAYGPKVAEVLTTLKDEEISQPFQTEAGWHLIQMLGKREQDKTREAQREQARQAIQERKADEEYDNFLRTLRSEAYVEVRLPGFDKDGKPLENGGTP
ncbi:MAG TPA: peptidylprolyl isomerase, partial [Rhodanobacteraceae bacterium]|nr:peptidylprolyl isomerase [Rhodanobacteraceae bacterium]